MALTWMLTRKTFDEIVPSVLKKVMTLGFFLALLTNAGTWVPDVIGSFVDAGQQAGSYQTLTPSTIMTDAVGASVGILTGTTPAAAGQPAAAQQSFWGKVLSTVKSATSPIGDIEDVLLRIIVAFAVFAALTYIAIELLVLLIESYVVIGAGVLFLGFGGSRWTTKFVDGYLNYMVSLGTKLFVLYLIVGALVFQVLPTINTMLSSLTSGFSASTGLEAMGATAVMAMLAKTLPHHASSLLSGASSLSGGHGVDAVKSVGKAAVAVGAVAAAPAVLAAGAARAAGGE
jgi:type IV secretion system protein TrbL